MRSEIHSLQILRGVAAMMVVTNHFWGSVFGGVFKFNGGFGVDLFFVLSGFLMVYTQSEKRGPIKFFMGRVKRILPLYIIISLPLILMYINLHDIYPLISNILLLPSFGNYHHELANGPAWTLVYEMIFYAFFSISLIISRNNIKACFISVGIIIASLYITTNIIGVEPRYGWIHLGYILGDSLMLDFAAGCVIAVAYQQLKIKPFIDFKILSLIVIGVIYIVLNVFDNARIYRFGIPAMVLILVAIYTKQGAGIFYKTLHIIGDASFSIYLAHIYFSYAIKATMLTNHTSIEMTKLSVVLLTIICVLFGIFINRTVEKPLMRFLSSKNNTKAHNPVE
jgi:peptidoglycan/LPS O-acetylase OafA/YrhL